MRSGDLKQATPVDRGEWSCRTIIHPFLGVVKFGIREKVKLLRQQGVRDRALGEEARTLGAPWLAFVWVREEEVDHQGA